MDHTENELIVSTEDFKLIKSFYPKFMRKESIKTNFFVIDWNALMPVVEKINVTLSSKVGGEIGCNNISQDLPYQRYAANHY